MLGLVGSSEIDHILLVSSTKTISLYIMTQKKKNQVVMPLEVTVAEDEDETERYQTSTGKALAVNVVMAAFEANSLR
jgi:riboflavin synthase